MRIIIKSLLLVCSLITVYFHYHNNISAEIQYDIYNDMNSGTYKEETTARFNILNLDFPDLSLTTLPMKGLISRYYYLGAQYSKALDLLNESKDANPYIMYNESVKSEIFDKLGVLDSALVYAEKAFTGIPHNQKHYLLLSKIYLSTGNYSKLDSIFKIVEKKNRPALWNFYLASALTREDSLSDYVKEKAREAVYKFTGAQEYSNIKLTSIYILYGKENIDESIKLAELASKYFDEENYRLAAKYYGDADNLNPLEYTFFENAGISNYKFGYYDRSIPYLNQVIDSLNPSTGKSEFVLAQTYAALEDFEKACKYIYDSSRFDYTPAYQLIGEYCAKAKNDKSIKTE